MHDAGRPTTAERWGVALLAVRPAYVVVELAVAGAASGYSLVDDSVSDLGTAASAWRTAMNTAFVVVGALLVAGALLLRHRLGAVVTVLLVVAGLSSVATGLAPLDRDATLHALAATPLFVAQPLALVLLAARLRRTRPLVAGALALTGAVTATAAAVFVVTGSGLVERVALWPVLVALAAAGAAVAGDRRLGGSTP